MDGEPDRLEALTAAAERYRLLFRHSPVGIVNFDARGVVTDCNDRFAAIMGAPRERFLGFDMHGGLQDERVRAAVGTALQGGVATFEGEYRSAVSGRSIHLKGTLGPALAADGATITGGIGIVEDVGESRRAERELRERERLLTALVDAEPECVKLLDAAGRLLLMNPSGLAMIEADSFEQVRGKCVCPLVAAEDRPAFEDLIGRVFRGESGTLEFDTVGLKGRRVRLETHAVPLRDEAGTIVSLLGVTRDVTEARRVEGALRESAERYRDLFENANDAIFILDAEHRYVDANRRAVELFGFRREEFVGRTVFEFIPAAQHPRSEAAFGELVRRGRYDAFEGRMRAKDGRWLDVEVSSSAIVQDGAFVGSRDIVRDVTERKRAEALIASILETVDEGFIIVAPDYRVLSVNRAYAEQAGLAADGIVGRHCYEVSHGLGRPCHEAGEECAVRRVFATGEPAAATHVHRDREGTPLFVETKAFPMRDASGAVTAAIEIVNDVTERRRLEDQLRHAQKMEAVGLLAGGVAHDFNNILTAITGYANLMEMKLPAEHPVRGYADEVLAAAERAAALTRGLLAFSRKQVVDPRPVDLGGIVSRLETLLLRVVGESIRLVVDRPPGELTILADVSQIEQVLMNLAANARDAMPGGGTLTISTRRETPGPAARRELGLEGEGPWAVLRISDTGTGMDERTRQRIFEPFYTTKELGRGTGLGLAIVYGIVRQSRGQIAVASELGEGTTFAVYLPVVAGDAEESASPAASLRAQPGGSGTVLVAEDDAALRGLVRTVLREFGYEVVEAADGEEALRLFAAHRDAIALAVLDVIMPGRNGREVFEALRAERPGLPVLFVSGYSDDILDGELLRRGGCAFLAKPLSPADLLAAVRGLIGG